MALNYKFLASSPISPFVKEVSFNLKLGFPMVKLKGISRITSNILRENQPSPIVRRSAYYNPTLWKHEFIQSLSTPFTEEKYGKRLNELKTEVRALMSQITEDPLKQLELIDTLQRLGISYHFESEIKDILQNIRNNNNNDWRKNNLYATALGFRLIRKQGFKISQEVFNGFIDEMGNFNKHLCEDAKGMLCLYEASFLLKEGENILEAAKCFTGSYLKKYMSNLRKDELEFAILKHALELPLHVRITRLEARWFFDIYERKEEMNPIILEMAKLDFNIVQSMHQEDLKYLSSWWRSTGLGEELSFARDRLMENFFWTVGSGFEPEFRYFRIMTTKLNSLITIIDDIYDVYGTLDELELFTDAVERWNIAAMDQLPEYMKTCFLTLHNSINEMAFEVLRDHGINVIKYLKKVWVDFCKSYLLEAKWYYSGYKPTLEEYINNGKFSIGGYVVLVHLYVLVTTPTKNEDFECLNGSIDVITLAAIIARLADDLGTSPDELKRGDNPKSIQCYMNEAGVSESKAREYIRHFIDETWKKLNEIETENSVFPKVFIELCKNGARMAECVYQYGDGHAIMHKETKDYVVSLFIKPIPI